MQQATSAPHLAGSESSKDFRERTFRTLKVSLGKLWRRRSVTITEYDPTYKVAYLGNVLTGWAKGDGCVEKPLSTLWKNYTGSCKSDVQMKVTVTQSGLKAVTKEHGLTEYWSHRITYCAAPGSFPRVFCWVYRHEGRKLKQELRCHAVLCSKEAVARRMASQLRARLAQALSDFKRDKVCRQNARLSLANSVYDNPSLPRRKILLSTGSHNYRPPLERSKSAPKLMVIEESLEEGDEDDQTRVAETNKTEERLHREDVVNEESFFLDMEGRLSPEQEHHVRDLISLFDRPGEEQGTKNYREARRPSNGRRRSSLNSLQKKVAWNLDNSGPEPRHSPYQSERLLIIGSALRESAFNVEQTIAESESDEGSNSLQSISSSGSSGSADTAFKFPDQDELSDDVGVDLRPSGNKVDLERLTVQLKRSATFPPPSALLIEASELDSLSEEDDNVSDESGYAELTDHGADMGQQQ